MQQELSVLSMISTGWRARQRRLRALTGAGLLALVTAVLISMPTQAATASPSPSPVSSASPPASPSPDVATLVGVKAVVMVTVYSGTALSTVRFIATGSVPDESVPVTVTV